MGLVQMWPTLCAALLLCLALETAGYLSDFPGSYCRTRHGGCCTNRTDSCAVPISSTLCYCDEFCARGETGDCCPDYEPFCLGIDIGPPGPITAHCSYKGTSLGQFETVKDNCNLCKCQGKNEIKCEENECLIDENLIHNVNRLYDTLGWTATKYAEFWGRTYATGLDLRLGTKEPTRRVKAMSKLSNKIEKLPREFDSRNHWLGLVTEVRDQGWCGSSWAISTASVASDRFGIQTKGKEAVELAPQHLLSCVRRQTGCGGGHLDWAWNYIRKIGLVDEECYPYSAVPGHCKVHRTSTLSSIGCKLPTTVPRDHMYRVGPAYSLNNETDIMIEIMESGPVQATMRVYRDFFSYRSGIYKRSVANRGDLSGFHSVRLVGWGEEQSGYSTTKYWIAANSWGTWWGEDGYFRILRGVNECEIENYVLATWPHAHLTPKKSKSPRRPFW